MAATWIARAFAGIALLAWLLEDFAIAAAGGPGESGLEDPLFGAGMTAYLLGAIVLGVVIAGNEAGRRRLFAGIFAVALALATIFVLSPVVQSWLPDGWFSDRAGYLVAALALLALSMSTHAVRRRRRARDKDDEARRREQDEQDEQDRAEDDPAT